MTKNNSQFQKVKRELRNKLPKDLDKIVTGIVLISKTSVHKDYREGFSGELETKLPPLGGLEDKYFSVYLTKNPSEQIALPSMYRGVTLVYKIIGEIKLL
jgi:hypothetical protein